MPVNNDQGKEGQRKLNVCGTIQRKVLSFLFLKMHEYDSIAKTFRRTVIF